MRLSLAGYRGDSSDTRSGVGCVGRCGGTFSEILIPAAAEEESAHPPTHPPSTGGKNGRRSSGDVKTGKTSLSARINIWINPGFLMQSGALAIPSVERRLLDELSKPPRPKEINWKPPPPPFSPSGH